MRGQLEVLATIGLGQLPRTVAAARDRMDPDPWPAVRAALIAWQAEGRAVYRRPDRTVWDVVDLTAATPEDLSATMLEVHDPGLALVFSIRQTWRDQGGWLLG